MDAHDFDSGGSGHVMELSPRAANNIGVLTDQASDGGLAGGLGRGRGAGTAPVQRSRAGAPQPAAPATPIWQLSERRPLQLRRDGATSAGSRPVQRTPVGTPRTKKATSTPAKADPDDKYSGEVKEALRFNRKKLSVADAITLVNVLEPFAQFLGLPGEKASAARAELQTLPPTPAGVGSPGAEKSPPITPEIKFAELLHQTSGYLQAEPTYQALPQVRKAILAIQAAGQPKWVAEAMAFYKGSPKGEQGGSSKSSQKPSRALIRDLRSRADKDPAARALSARLLASDPSEVTPEFVWLLHLAQKADGAALEGREQRADFLRLGREDKYAFGTKGQLRTLGDSLEDSQHSSRMEQLVSEYDTSKGKLSREEVRRMLKIKYKPDGRTLSDEFKSAISKAAEKEGKARDEYIRHPLVSDTLDPTGEEYKQSVPAWGQELATIHGTSVKVKMNVTMECRTKAEPTGGLAYQCAELAMRFSQLHWGLSIGGDGGKFATPGAIAALEVFQAGETKEAPRSYDFVAYRSGAWGHVGVISNVVQSGDTMTAQVHQQNVRGKPSELSQAKADADLTTTFTRVNGRWTGGSFGYQAFDAWSRPKTEVARARAEDAKAPFPLEDCPELQEIADRMASDGPSQPDAKLVQLFRRLALYDAAVLRKAWHAYAQHRGQSNALATDLGRAIQAGKLTRSQAEQVVMEFREAGIDAPDPTHAPGEGGVSSVSGPAAGDESGSASTATTSASTSPGGPRLRQITPKPGNAYPAFAHYQILGTPAAAEAGPSEGLEQTPAAAGQPQKSSASSPNSPTVSTQITAAASKDKKTPPNTAQLEVGAQGDYALLLVARPPKLKPQSSKVKDGPQVYADDIPAPTAPPTQIYWFLDKVREERVALLEGRDTKKVRVTWRKAGDFTLVCKVVTRAGAYGEPQETTHPVVYYVRFRQSVLKSTGPGGGEAASLEPPEPAGDSLMDALHHRRWEHDHPTEAAAYMAAHPEEAPDPKGLAELDRKLNGQSLSDFFARADSFVAEYRSDKGTLPDAEALHAWLIKYESGPFVEGEVSSEFKRRFRADADAQGSPALARYHKGPLKPQKEATPGAELQHIFPEYGKELHTIPEIGVPVRMNILKAAYPGALGLFPGAGEGFQCAELAFRVGHAVGTPHNANGGRYATPGALAGISVFLAGETDEPPQDFDYVSYANGGYGHVGVISGVQAEGAAITAHVHQQNVVDKPSEEDRAKALANQATRFERKQGRWSGGAFYGSSGAFQAWARPTAKVKEQREKERAFPADPEALLHFTHLTACMKVGSRFTPEATLEAFLSLFSCGSRVIRMTWHLYNAGSSGDIRLIRDLARTFTQARAADALFVLQRFKEAGIEDVPMSALYQTSLEEKLSKDRTASAREKTAKASPAKTDAAKAKKNRAESDKKAGKEPTAEEIARRARQEQLERDRAAARQEGDALAGPIEAYRLIASKSSSSWPKNAHFALSPVVTRTRVASEGPVTPGTELTYSLTQLLEPQVSGAGVLNEGNPPPRKAHFSPADVRWMAIGDSRLKRPTAHGQSAWTIRWPREGRFEVAALFNAQVGAKGEPADSPGHVVTYEVRLVQDVVNKDALKRLLPPPTLTRKAKGAIQKGARERFDLKLEYPKKHQTTRTAQGAPYYDVRWSVGLGDGASREALTPELKALLEQKQTEWKQVFYQQWKASPSWEVVWDVPAGSYSVQAEASYSSESAESEATPPLRVSVQIEEAVPSRKKGR